MQTSQWVFSAFFVTAIAACEPTDRNYGGTGGQGGKNDVGGAGGQGGQGGQGGDPAIEAVCKDYGAAVCDRYAQCGPAIITRDFGDVPTCRDRYAIYCNAVLTAPGTGWTPDTMRTCFNTYASLDCDIFVALPLRSIDELVPMACIPPTGAIPDGSFCIDDAQCKSGHCVHQIGVACGTCGPRMDANGPCMSNSDCLAHQVCFANKCDYVQEEGGQCGGMSNAKCNANLVCFQNQCVKRGILGDMCYSYTCSSVLGFYCNDGTSTCQNITYAAPGYGCGSISNIACRSSGFCVGTCLAAAADDATCDPLNGPICMPPASCVNGKCLVPDGAACN